MTNQQKIDALRGRQALILARGPHNARIAAKIGRKIRKLEKENANG